MARLNVLVIPDKFKGTLTAGTAAQAIARGWRRARPLDTLTLLPMTDGGDGFGETMSELLGAKAQTIETLDAAHQPCASRWWWHARTRTAVIESAAVIGLATLPPGRFHPFDLDTQGLGSVLRAAAEKGARRCLIGIGGSATNDGGFGLARALGWKFLDRAGHPLERWVELGRLSALGRPARRRWFERLIVATDVRNPLLGVRGATRIYGPQKGLRPVDFSLAEKCLQRLASVLRRPSGRALARRLGAGAAGGLGFGLMAFAQGRLEPGFELFARLAHLETKLRASDLVLTGEGAIDDSTLMGKGVGQLARQCRALRLPCIGLAGSTRLTARERALFFDVRALTSLTSAANAKTSAALWLERLSSLAARALRLGIC